MNPPSHYIVAAVRGFPRAVSAFLFWLTASQNPRKRVLADIRRRAKRQTSIPPRVGLYRTTALTTTGVLIPSEQTARTEFSYHEGWPHAVFVVVNRNDAEYGVPILRDVVVDALAGMTTAGHNILLHRSGKMLHLSFLGPTKYYAMYVKADDVIEFLSMTHVIVPVGTEQMDWTEVEKGLGLPKGSLTDDGGDSDG